MLFGIITILVTIFTSVVSIALLSKKGNADKQSKKLGLLFLFLSFWGITTIINTLISNYLIVLISTRLSYIFGAYLIISFLDFLLSFRNINLSKIYYFLTVPISLFFIISNKFVKDISFNSTSGSSPILGEYFNIYAYILSPLILVAFYNIYLSYKESRGEQLLKLRYILLGMVTSALLLTFTSLILPSINITFFIPFSFLWILPTVISGTYSFFYEKVYDINFILGNFGLKSFYVIALFIVYNLITYMQIQLWGGVFNFNAYSSGIIISIIFVFIAEKIVGNLNQFIYKNFIYHGRNPELVLRSLRKKLDQANEVRDINTILIETLKKIFPIEKVYIVDTSDKIKRYLTIPIVKKNYNIAKKGGGISIIHTNIKYSFIILVPKGFVLLGETSRDFAYTINDIKILTSVFDTYKISNERVKYTQKLKNLNNKLQKLVEKRTEQLDYKIRLLQQSREKEKDMIDILGHELRTPASVAKINLSILNEKLTKTKIDRAELKPHLERIALGIESQLNIINHLLTSAKLEGNRLEIVKESIDVNESIETSIENHKTEAISKGIKIEFEKKKLPLASADKVRFVEIINNLLNNAIKYTDKGFIKIYTSFNVKFIEISFKDTGRGIAKEELKNLGQKFYRIDYGKNQRKRLVKPGGTGLGLFVVFGLVKVFGGDIKVESKLGEGSTFTFTVPIANKKNKLATTDKNLFKRLKFK